MAAVEVVVQRGVDGTLGFKLAGSKAPFAVAALVPGSPAAAAGLREGDVVLNVDGIDISAPGRPLAMASGALRTASGPDISIMVQRGSPTETAPTAAEVPAVVVDVQVSAAKESPPVAAEVQPPTAEVQPPTADVQLPAAEVQPPTAAEAQQPTAEDPSTAAAMPPPAHTPEASAALPVIAVEPTSADGAAPDASGKETNAAATVLVLAPTADTRASAELADAAETSTDDITVGHTEESVTAPTRAVAARSPKPQLPPKPQLKPKPKLAPHKPTESFALLVRDIASQSLVGTRHGSTNQDLAYHTTFRVPGGEAQVAAVFDGHGLLGEVAAEVAVAALTEALPTLPWASLRDTPEAFMTGLFERLDAAVLAAHDNPPEEYSYTSGSTTMTFELRVDADPVLGSMYYCPAEPRMPPRPIDFGCTAVVAVCLGTHLVVGNAGDAAGLLVSSNVDGCEDRDGFAAEHFTAKHTALNEAEQARIDRDFPGEAHFTQDGYLAPTDPVLSQYELQLTRSLGHRLLRQAGVSSVPDCFVVAVSPAHTYALVLCSDGVTDELSPSDVMDRVIAAGDARDAACTLCKDAQDYCMDETKIDDTTALVLYFQTHVDEDADGSREM